MTLVQKLWSHQHRHENAKGLVTQRSRVSKGGSVCLRCQRVLADRYYNAFIIYLRGVAFANKVNNVMQCWCSAPSDGSQKIRGRKQKWANRGHLKYRCSRQFLLFVLVLNLRTTSSVFLFVSLEAGETRRQT